MTSRLEIGSVIKFAGQTSSEIVLDIYDDEVFHTIDHQGTVMQYGSDCSFEFVGQVDIISELTSIRNKLSQVG